MLSFPFYLAQDKKLQFLVTLPKSSHSSKETRYTFPSGILIPLSTRKLLIMKYALPSISTAPRIFWGECVVGLQDLQQSSCCFPHHTLQQNLFYRMAQMKSLIA